MTVNPRDKCSTCLKSQIEKKYIKIYILDLNELGFNAYFVKDRKSTIMACI